MLRFWNVTFNKKHNMFDPRRYLYGNVHKLNVFVY